MDSWFDPSRTGYFENTPTTIPVLRKIDVIELQKEPYATEVGPPRDEDLAFGNPEYQFGYGDVLEIQINDLFQEGKPEGFKRTVDQSGKILLPVVGQIDCAGMTQQQVQEEIVKKLSPVIPNPEVAVSVSDARNYTYTIIGDVRSPGMYGLTRPDFTVTRAIGLSGGAADGTKRIRIVRVVPEGVEAERNKPHPKPAQESGAGAQPSTDGTKQPETKQPEPTIDDLINQIAPTGGAAPVPPTAPPVPPPATQPAAPPVPPPATQPATAPPSAPPLEPPTPSDHSNPLASPGALRAAVPPVDIEQLQAPSTRDTPNVRTEAEARAAAQSLPSGEEQYIFDRERQTWVLVPASEAARYERPPLLEPNSPDGAVTGPAAATALKSRIPLPGSYRLPTGQKTRVIEIEWEKLKQGDLKLNAVVRPDDIIYVEVDSGVVYIDGEIARPGVYSLPAVGDLTLSRIVSAAGGLGQIAVPSRVDLIRKVGSDREAVIRVNLAAIRNRSEPDIQLRADDHIIIGTTFWATPLAVIRNGFRMTYGFGFLLDRNFGNDVFGAPPTNVLGN